MNPVGFAFLCYVVLMIFLCIKFPIVFIGSIVLSLLFVGYFAVFGHRIPMDTNLWKGGAGND
jgi:hypothetical protein